MPCVGRVRAPRLLLLAGIGKTDTGNLHGDRCCTFDYGWEVGWIVELRSARSRRPVEMNVEPGRT